MYFMFTFDRRSCYSITEYASYKNLSSVSAGIMSFHDMTDVIRLLAPSLTSLTWQCIPLFRQFGLGILKKQPICERNLYDSRKMFIVFSPFQLFPKEENFYPVCTSKSAFLQHPSLRFQFAQFSITAPPSPNTTNWLQTFDIRTFWVLVCWFSNTDRRVELQSTVNFKNRFLQYQKTACVTAILMYQSNR